MLDPIRLKIKGDALVLSLFFAALALFFAFQTACPAEGATITVTNNTEVINGDTTGPEALTDNPGPDGISLPEAMWAALSASGPHVILFAPSLKGSTIALTGFLPSLSSGLITIDGEIDGAAAVTIDGSGSSDSVCFRIFASDVTIKGLAIINFSWSGIQVFTDSTQGRTVIERVRIEGNEISAGWVGIDVYNWGQGCSIGNVEVKNNKLINNGSYGISIASAAGPSNANNQVTDIIIAENTISNVPGNKTAISVMGATNRGSTNNVISNLDISGNTITGHTYNNLLISAGNEQDCVNNRIEGVLIRGNTIDGSPVSMEILGGVGSGAQGNRVHHVSILDNTLRGGGIQLVGGQGSNAAQNSIDTVFIGRNRVSNAAANGLFFVGGSDGASNNEITNATVFNNGIAGSRDAGILLHGHDGFTPNNIIEGVNIFNNTIVANGNSWAGGININTKSATNSITGVKISNTILWNNAGDDAIRGSESPESVGCSVLNDSRYVGNDGNFYASPEFVDPAGGDYHLAANSPCVDKGDNSAVAGIDTDIDHDPRVVDGDKSGTAIVDIGCDEYVPETPTAGDINGDGNVDLADAILALQVLVEKTPAGIRPGVDVNRDEKIGLEEIIYVLQVLAGLRYETRHSVSACKEPGDPNYDTDSERFAAEVVDCKLIVRHIDAVYNCCIEDIAVSVTVSDQVIDLFETEILSAPCDCLCPYDITTEIFNLPPGVYTVQVRSERGLLGTIKDVVVPECPVCRDNTDCSEGFYCSKKEGDCDGVGRCSPKPQACITLWDPVCGCDGGTYGNACDASASGTSVAHLGPCQ